MNHDFNNIIKEHRKKTFLNLQLLESASEDEFHDLIINYVTWREDRPVNENSLARFDDPVRYTYATYMADTDILCGGLEQYYINSGFIYVEDAIRGYRYFGLLAVSELLSRAKSAKLEADWASAARIEKEFHSLGVDFNRIRYEYFLENRQLFIPKPDKFYGW